MTRPTSLSQGPDLKMLLPPTLHTSIFDTNTPSYCQQVTMWGTIALAVTVLVILCCMANFRPSGFPQGPFALPLLGNIVSILLYSPPVALQKFADKYGGILSFKTFGRWNVLITDVEIMKTALASSVFSDRIDLLLFDVRDQIIMGDKWARLGIISTSGEVWKNQRRFTLRSLKDLGFGRQSIEPIMRSELEDLLEYFSRRQGQKLDIGLVFNKSIVNVIWALVIGKRFSHTDARLHQLVDKVNKMIQSFNPFHPALQWRWFKKLFPNLKIIRETEGYMVDFLKFIEEEMAQHQLETGGVDDSTSYIGAYQLEMKEAAQEGRETPLTLPHLKANVLELFLAGSETTSTSLWWAVYLLASNPKVQQTMQEELDQVVGRDNLPTLDHMDSVPYTTAAIYEVQRVGDLVPISIPHQTSQDTVLGEYNIPKGTCVLFNLSGALKDPRYWKHPDRFWPEHFLTPEGKVFKPEPFLPFGSGKRVCLGESLARLELFLFITTLVHKFSWRLSDDPVVWHKSNIVTRPPSYTVVATSRKDDPTPTLKR
ncbi:cytochrome P450 2J6 [Procambarus clarkii]|uniref:cytochrome P450 2J6 n=1 Tax=Procambarus clarkii TaxID=6728 RepID=UPI001E67836D|nr:cytochrome P450 2J6-like [Procambarus clarkii]